MLFESPGSELRAGDFGALVSARRLGKTLWLLQRGSRRLRVLLSPKRPCSGCAPVPKCRPRPLHLVIAFATPLAAYQRLLFPAASVLSTSHTERPRCCRKANLYFGALLAAPRAGVPKLAA